MDTRTAGLPWAPPLRVRRRALIGLLGPRRFASGAQQPGWASPHSVVVSDLEYRPSTGPRPMRIAKLLRLHADRSDSMKGAFMTGPTPPTPYVHFPGTAREALTFYGDAFGCSVQLHTFAEFGRTDGPAETIAHGYLTEGPIRLFAADVVANEPSVRCEGMMLSLLGTAAPSVLRDWFSKLSEGGRVVDDFQERPWGASDGQVIDRYGLHWLIGFEHGDNG
jgi:PhnB protein